MRKIGWVAQWVQHLHSRADYQQLGYPCELPPLSFRPGLDVLLLELPPRYLPFMPNGLGYVSKILEREPVTFQVADVNIHAYHHFHRARLMTKGASLLLSGGGKMVEDPWDNSQTAQWQREEVLNYFQPLLNHLMEQIAVAAPKMIGLSLSGINRMFAKRLVLALRCRMPELLIMVGGYDCVYHELGPFLFPDFDYMVIGEAELTLPTLAKAIARGERPKDLPGIISRWDTPGRPWQAPLPQDLDAVGFPTYDWANLAWYQTYDRKHLIPISGSRGCRWGRCRFCAECFPFRMRKPEAVVEEIEFFARVGLHSFHFNESDVNGDPQNLHDICTLILNRGLSVSLMGQLRIDRHNTAKYFQHLAKAGFKHLRFGVDGWTDALLQKQRKGYNMELVFQNLRDCHAAGIRTTVNMVIGVPGETEAEVDESIANILRCRDWIHEIESFNTLLLACGSEYQKNPEAYKIRFRKPAQELARQYVDYIPTDLWYSEEPYIDQEIRMARLDRILLALYQNGMKIGPFASRVVEQLKNKVPESVACAAEAH